MNMLPALMRIMIGNPLTSVPGAIGIIAMLGPVVTDLGQAMVAIGANQDFWTVIGAFLAKPEVMAFGNSIGLLMAKDFNTTGGTKQQ